MSGQIIFFSGAALICLPRGGLAIYAFTTGLPWFILAAGAAFVLNVAYCAWRGERWAYYLLMFLCILNLVLAGVFLPTVHSTAELLLRVLEIISVALGGGLIGIHPRAQEFMQEQSVRFSVS